MRTIIATLAPFAAAAAMLAAAATLHHAPAPTMPVCTTAQVAVSDSFHAHGLANPMEGLCDDAESLGV
jgi:hypothetical protein